MAGMRYQPQGRRQIDPGARLSRGLISYLPLAGASAPDAVDGLAWTPVVASLPVSFGCAPRGLGLRMKGASPAYFTRAIPAGLTTQPFTLRYRLFVNALSSPCALLSWGNSSRDGFPRYYARLVSGALSVYYSSGYRSTVAIAAQTEYIVTHTYDGATHVMYINGVIVGTATAALSGGASNLYVGSGYDGVPAAADNIISDFAVWNRTLSAAEVTRDAQNPWQLFADPEEDDEFFLRAATGSSITVTPASLLLSDGEVAIRVSRRVGVQPAALAVTGGDISLHAARRLGAQPSALELSPGQVAIKAARVVKADPAALEMGSGAVRLRASRRLSVAPVVMTVAGGSVQFVYTQAPSAGSYVMAVTSGALSLTGGTVGMRVTRRVSAASAALALSAGDARMLAGYRLAVDPVVLAMSGGPALLRAARRIQVDPAQLAISGGAVALRYSQQIEYARAPAGSGYSPQRIEVQARPAQIGSFRPASIQRNDR